MTQPVASSLPRPSAESLAAVGIAAPSSTREDPNRWRGVRVALFEVLPRLLAVTLVALALYEGLALRAWVFEWTAPVRFRGDIQNGLTQGSRVLRNAGAEPTLGTRVPVADVLRAWVATYDQVYEQGRPRRNGTVRFSLDYAPLRLLVMSFWAREVWATQANPAVYDDATAGPLMRFNAGCAAVAAAGMFALVHHWALRGRRASGRAPPPRALSYATWHSSPRDALARHSPWAVALLAAALVWFNPAAIINAHAFPQWDVWVLPFFLWACFTASRGWWLTTGFLIVAGAMLKGQVLLVAPVLIVWPLLTGNIPGLLRLGVGAAAAVALVAWPWLVRSPEVWRWMLVATVGAVVLASAKALLWRKAKPAKTWHRRLSLAGLVVATVLALATMVYPAASFAWRDPFALAVGGLGVVAVVCLLRSPWRSLPFVAAGVLALTVLLGGWKLGGSWSWYEIGFEFPTRNYLVPALGPTANLPAIMGRRYGWQIYSPVADLPEALRPILGVDVLTFKVAMRGLYFLLLVPIAVMLAWHARRNSPRALLCMMAPWVLMFALVPQMHERYLVWGAVATAACVLLGPGQLLLHLVTTFFAFACIAFQVLSQNPAWWSAANRFFGNMIPDAGWAVALLAGVYLYACLSPPAKPPNPPRPDAPPPLQPPP